MWSFQRVGAPVPSPDGKWVVFSVAEVTYDPTKDVSDLWIVPTDGHARAATPDVEQGQRERTVMERRQHAGSHSRRNAMTTRSRRFMCSTSALGGEAQRVTNTRDRSERTEVESGRQTHRVPGGHVARRDRRGIQSEGSAGAEERQVEGSRLRDIPDPQFRSLDRRVEAALWIVDVGGDRKGTIRCLPDRHWPAQAGYNGDGLSPPGRPTASRSCSRRRTRADAGARAMVVVVDLAGAARRRRTEATRRRRAGTSARRASAPTARRSALVRPTGRRRFTRCRGSPAAAWPMTGQPVRILAKDLDRPVGSWAFTPDSRTIYFTAEDAGHEHVYSVPVAGGAATLVARCAAGRLHRRSTSRARGIDAAARRQLGKRGQPARDRADRSGDEETRFPDVVQYRQGRVDRLAAAARLLVHRPRTAGAFTAMSRCRRSSTRRRSIRCWC